jgi:hypothetical protein
MDSFDQLSSSWNDFVSELFINEDGNAAKEFMLGGVTLAG